MRYIILSDGYPPQRQGGAETMAALMATRLVAAGHVVHVITASADAVPVPDRQQHGVTVHTIRARVPERWAGWLGVYNPAALRQVDHLIGRLQPDIVHAHNIHRDLSWYCLHIAHRHGAQVAFTAHDLMSVTYGKLTHFAVPGARPPFNTDQLHLPPLWNIRLMRARYNPIRNVVIHALVQQVPTRIAVSDLQRHALQANGMPDFTVRHNQIDETLWATCTPESVTAFQAEHHLSGRKIILFAGRVDQNKGSDHLIRAFAQAHRHDPTLLLLLLMRGDLAIAPPYADLKTQGHIRTAGWLTGDALRTAFHSAACICVPSVYLDPFPTVVLEGLAAGRPVLVSHFSGGTEALVNGHRPIIIDPFDTPTFATRILEATQAV